MFNISELTFYKPFFAIEILAALFIFGLYLNKRQRYIPFRYIAIIVVSLTFSILYPIIPSISYTPWYSSIMFFAIFSLCCLSTLFLYKEKMYKLFYLFALSYAGQHLSYELNGLIMNLFNQANIFLGAYSSSQAASLDFSEFMFQIFIYLICVISTYSAIFFLYAKRIKRMDVKISSIAMIFLSFLLLTVCIIVNSILIYSGIKVDKMIQWILSFYNIISCGLILFILASIASNKQLEVELTITSKLLQQAEAQYIQLKENAELINVKCHDLKHQIRMFGEKANIDKDAIREIQNMINIYDSNIKTNNDTLDLILNEKSLLCQKKGINLKYFGNAKDLSFIRNNDLYSLFGNVLDNAIEASVNMSDSKRLINIIVNHINDFITIRIDNFFDKEINFDDEGMPLTKKQNKDYHGFGIKSIKMIVDKYGGNMKIAIKDDIFSLNLLFPIKQK